MVSGSGRPRRWVRQVAAFVLCGLAAAVIAAPVVLERAVEGVRFRDELGTFPVVVGLSHDGRSTLDTGLFGKVYYDRTGALGFGAYARSTGPPEAGGTLASYVDNRFLQTNAALIRDPRRVVRSYSAALSDALADRVLRDEIVVFWVGGALLLVVVRVRRFRRVPRSRAVVVSTVAVVLATGLSSALAADLFQGWSRAGAAGPAFVSPGIDHLSFSSRETREVASQVRPFITKNTERIDAAAKRYQQDAASSLTTALAGRSPDLAPREGEQILIAEADPQGSFVGTRVRRDLAEKLLALLGRDAFAARTVSGDVSSNGTVAEASYIAAEADVAPSIPAVVVAGDHDSRITWKQMKDQKLVVVDGQVTIGGLRFAGANDREHKSLFGGQVSNPSGVSEQELGDRVRQDVEGEDAGSTMLLHQPDAVAGLLGLEDLTSVRGVEGSATTPYDDGIADQPPGLVNVGHLHEQAGPWVLWNTDTDVVTWTVVNQLGTAGGVENHPTFSRFSTPFSTPLKPISVTLEYVRGDSGLQTGYASITCDLQARCTVSTRTDVGLPGGQPGRPGGR